jgi:hypothetical protein
MLVSPLWSLAQSGNWDSFGTTGTTGYTDHGNGVIQLLDETASGCAGAAVHETSSTYNPVTDGTFSQCYEVYFGCPGDDEIGSDTKGDGLAFSFSDCAWSVGDCGGGLGYRNACTKMITVEFDTWSSQGTSSFDSNYEGSDVDDQVALHKDGDPEDWGKLAGANPGNLEDGQEHTVCISYDPSTDIFTVSIDGSNVLVHDLTGSGYELETYFGSVGLYQSWSSGKNGATNPATVSHGQDISDQVGGTLCDEGVYITNPTASSVFSSCDGVSIEADVIAPYGETIDSVEFFIDGSKVGKDLTADYAYTYNPSAQGTESITSTAYFSDGSDLTSDPVSLTIGGKIEEAASAPTINGHAESFWDNFIALDLTQGYNSSPDLAATYKIAYDATNLYVLITVEDDDLRDDSGDDWDDDGAELYIDIGNDKAGSYGGDDYQYSLPYNGSVNEYKNSPGSLTGVTFGDSSYAGGYTLEISLPWSTLGGGSPTGGVEIGFDIKMNDDDGGGGRDHELGWNDGTFNAWSNPGLFGTQEFSDCIVLPMKLLYFEGMPTSEGIILDWLTIHEHQAATQEIQRSYNLMDWTTIGFVDPDVSRNSTSEYQFLDNTATEGTVYYRILQSSTDGQPEISKVISVDQDEELSTIFPTHFEESFEFITNRTGEIELHIVDILGRVCWSTTFESTGGTTTFYPALEPGSYYAQARHGGELILQEKVIK